MRAHRKTAASALLFALAFNLTFFLQELFLALGKALTPGLRPTLFHNNHTWTGRNPLAGLLQGTGALAIFAMGLVCVCALRREGRPTTARLFLIWMAFNGLMQSLSQIVIGAISAGSDLGMAMEFLQLPEALTVSAAAAALGAIVYVAHFLARQLLRFGVSIFAIATAPALLGLLLTIPFRVPRELLEVMLFPLIVTIPGIACMQLGAGEAVEPGEEASISIAIPAAALLLLLLFFQLILRPGIRFY